MKAALIAIISLIIVSASPLSFAGQFAPPAPPAPCCTPEIPLAKMPVIPRAPIHPVTITLYPGSLEYNIIRIAKNHGWSSVVWNYPADFQWVGLTHITAPSLQAAFIKLLSNYPLQAQFYHGNHVLAIAPRNLP